MSEEKFMTVNDLILLFQQLPPGVKIYIQSPEGSLISNGNLFVENKFINWFGQMALIKCDKWQEYPKEPY